MWLLIVCTSWSFRKKWGATVIVSAFTFISPVSSTMIAPATGQLAERFDIHSPTILAMISSVFVLGYGGILCFSPQTALLKVFAVVIAFGPLVIGPLSEIYGRSHVLQISNLWYLGKMHSLILLIAADGDSLCSVEFSVWFCHEQEYAHRVSLLSRTRWFSPTLYWWRRHR